jgi:SAM-dependent methyltransferase/uncharacterized protein YbaR (Trm112 family)
MQSPTFRSALLPILRCPFCAGRFDFDEKPGGPHARGAFGLLNCSCAVYPVIDGIPVIQRAPVQMLEHTRGTGETEGIAIADLVALVRRGDSLDALLECIAVPEFPPMLEKLMGWRLTASPRGRRWARTRGKRRMLDQVVARRDAIGARGVLDYYYLSGGSLDPAMGHYFIRRFGQPRHLAALALAATLSSDARPMLDIACGIGHLEHYLGSRRDAAPVVGLDMNFYHLWIAQHWMAPQGHCVCANASDGLPFADDSFAATICSDAYHYIGKRDRLLAEIERCAPARPVVLTRVGNAEVMPNEGIECSLAGYRAELGRADLRVFDEAELVRSYLRQLDPFAAPARSDHELVESKWLSLAWNVRKEGRRSIADDPVPPHAVGTLGLNPIYTRQVRPNGEVRLRFVFPMTWYAYENHAMLAYHPREVTLPGPLPQDLGDWQNQDALRSLVDRFVLLGLPRRFERGAQAATAVD